MATRHPKERFEVEDCDEAAVIHAAYRTVYGAMSAEVRVFGAFEADGKKYEFDRVLRIAAKPAK